jgi:DNA-damage-inducible protein D
MNNSILTNYTKLDNFINIINKAKIACKTSVHPILSHFADVGKMVKLGLKSNKKLAIN